MNSPSRRDLGAVQVGFMEEVEAKDDILNDSEISDRDRDTRLEEF